MSSNHSAISNHRAQGVTRVVLPSVRSWDCSLESLHAIQNAQPVNNFGAPPSRGHEAEKVPASLSDGCATRC